MKVGIITLPLGRNYGGVLQNYALQKVIIRLGHEPKTIKTLSDKYWLIRWIILDIREVFAFFRGKKKIALISPVQFYGGGRLFSCFVHNNIRMTKLYFRPSVILKKNDFDVLIVGSDQVWRPLYNPNIELSFLAFSQNYNVCRISYAASFGTEAWEYSKELEHRCRLCLRQFDAVSVRELSGVNLCKEHFGVDAEWVLDPTLLLTWRDYAEIALPRQCESPYIFVYMLDKDSDIMNKVNNFAESRGLPVVFKSAGLSVEKSDSIELWLSLIAHANIVVTDSYHGTLFSLIFEKQFVTIVNDSRGSARYQTLKSFLPISGRIIDRLSDFPEGDIKYSQISPIIEAYRDLSLKWLESAISLSRGYDCQVES